MKTPKKTFMQIAPRADKNKISSLLKTSKQKTVLTHPIPLPLLLLGENTRNAVSKATHSMLCNGRFCRGSSNESLSLPPILLQITYYEISFKIPGGFRQRHQYFRIFCILLNHFQHFHSELFKWLLPKSWWVNDNDSEVVLCSDLVGNLIKESQNQHNTNIATLVHHHRSSC